MPQHQYIRKCVFILTGVLLTLTLSSCTRFTSVRGVLVPTAGFPGYEQSSQVDGGEFLKFDGIYVLRNPFGAETHPHDLTISYFRFWDDGSMLFGYVDDIEANAIPTAQDADHLRNVYVGKFRYDPISNQMSTFSVYCRDSWFIREYKDMFRCTDDGRLILLPPGANYGKDKVGTEWRFIEIKDLKLEPFW